MQITTKNENSDPALLAQAGGILRRLTEPDAFARQGAELGLQIFTPRNRFKHPVANVSATMRKILQAHEWIAAMPGPPGRFAISDLGRSYLRRQGAEDMPFRAQHQVMRRKLERTLSGEAGSMICNEAETPLGWLLNRRGRDGKSYISLDQFTAGERLRQDFTLAQLTPRVTSVWGPPGSKAARGAVADSSGITDVAMAAKARFFAALDAVGPGLADVLTQICCHLMGLEEAERHMGWPVRSGKVVLCIALDRLAAHYGLAGRGKSGAKK